MEFSGTGAHCSLETCRQKDFLPFRCDSCDGVFCLEHRTFKTHDCPNAGDRDVRVVLCPACKSSFHVYASDLADVDRLVDEHMRMGGCERARRAKKLKKARTGCHVRGCKKTGLQPLRCRSCHHLVCLEHRFPSDHRCKGPAGRPGVGAATAAAAASCATQESRARAQKRHGAGAASAAGHVH